MIVCLIWCGNESAQTIKTIYRILGQNKPFDLCTHTRFDKMQDGGWGQTLLLPIAEYLLVYWGFERKGSDTFYACPKIISAPQLQPRVTNEQGHVCAGDDRTLIRKIIF